MALDFQIVFPQESIQLTSVELVPNSNPRLIAVSGADFTSVDQVLINDLVAPSYHVISKNELVAVIPDQVASGEIDAVNVTSRSLTITSKSLLKFRVSSVPSKVTGILRLVQMFVKVLFTTPGSDIFNPNLGGNGLRPLGQNFGKQQTGSILSDFVVAVDNTTRQIVAMQGRQSQLPLEERLLSATVTASEFSIEEGALITTVEVTSQAGRSAIASLVL